ncbi:MAG TPA: hypothetical protein VED37_11845 [Ktedonobacteraceae bacterium]|nr:hypothetical protein [Ktedonobacteraceae bacterium]
MDNTSGRPMPSSTKRVRTSADSYSRRRRVGVWLARCALAVGFLAGLYFSVVPLGRAQAHAMLILPDLLSASIPPWHYPSAAVCLVEQSKGPASRIEPTWPARRGAIDPLGDMLVVSPVD